MSGIPPLHSSPFVESKDFLLLNILTKRAITPIPAQITAQKTNASIKHSILDILYHSKSNKSKIKLKGRKNDGRKEE